MSGGNLKLKLNTAQAASSPQPSANPTPTPTTLKISLSRRPSEAVSASPVPLQTPTAAGKKRKQAESTEPASAKKSKIGPIRLGSQSNLQKPLFRKGSIVKLRKSVSNGQPSPTTPGGGQIRALRVKHKGKLPPRPLGVGYDSEAEDAEEDPAIEENIVLRMLPGPDCDYVRNAIAEKKLGIPVNQGGADISLRFFTKDARRAALKVQDRFYAAVLVDLPCIVETMKSWDRKGWWKSADICQLLLVTEQVANEDAARHTPLPKDLDPKTWQWPHGLTPPMYNVRKRRFRKRLSHKTIEQAELEVERLLEADEHARAYGGSSYVEVIDWEQLRREEEGEDVERDEVEEEQDAEGDLETIEIGDAHSQAVDDEDDADWQAQFVAQLGVDDEDDEPDTASATPALGVPAADDSQAPTPAAEVETPSVDVPSSLPEDEIQPETQPETPADATGSSDEEEDDDDEEDDEEEEDEDDEDDDEDDDEEEIDEEAREKQQYLAQQRAEIGHLERQISERREQLAKQANPLLKAKLLSTIKRFEEERDVKKRGLGDEDDDD